MLRAGLRRVLTLCALAALLGLSPLGAALAQEAQPSVEPGKPGAEPSAPEATKAKKKTAQRKTRKQQREEKKFQVEPRTAKVFEQARADLGAERYAEAEAALGDLNLHKLSPYERAQTHRLYAYIAYGRGESDKAIESLRQALAEEDSLPPRDRADVLYQIANIQAGQSRWSDVVATLGSWFQIVEQPNSASYYLLAMAHYQLGDLDAALPPAQKAVELAKAPQQSWLRLVLTIHLTRQDYEAAKRVLDETVALYPNTTKDAWLQLSTLHGVTGDEPRALGVLELAYRKGLLTEDRDIRRLLQFMVARGMPYRAATIFEQEMAKERFRDDPEAMELLSISWVLAREPARAMEPLSRAAELAKTGELYVRLAKIHLLDEKWEETVAILRKALAKGGLADPGAAQLMLGIAYFNEQKLPEARTSFTQAQRSGATREQAEMWLAHVDRAIASNGSAYGAAE